MDKIAELVKEFRENINDLDVSSETKEKMTMLFFERLLNVCHFMLQTEATKRIKGE